MSYTKVVSNSRSSDVELRSLEPLDCFSLGGRRYVVTERVCGIVQCRLLSDTKQARGLDAREIVTPLKATLTIED